MSALLSILDSIKNVGRRRLLMETIYIHSETLLPRYYPLPQFLLELNIKTTNYTLCIIKERVIIDIQRVMNERVIILWIAVKR